METVGILEQSLKLLKDEEGLMVFFKNLTAFQQNYLLEAGSKHSALGEILIRNKFYKYAK